MLIVVLVLTPLETGWCYYWSSNLCLRIVRNSLADCMCMMYELWTSERSPKSVFSFTKCAWCVNHEHPNQAPKVCSHLLNAYEVWIMKTKPQNVCLFIAGMILALTIYPFLKALIWWMSFFFTKMQKEGGHLDGQMSLEYWASSGVVMGHSMPFLCPGNREAGLWVRGVWGIGWAVIQLCSRDFFFD